MLTFSTSAMLKLVKCHKTNPLCHKALRKHKTFVDTRLHTCFTSCDLNASSEWHTPPALSYLRKVKRESDLAQLGYSPRDRGGRYIDEKLSKADKSVFLKLSATYRYRKMEVLKLSKNYRYRKMHQNLADK